MSKEDIEKAVKDAEKHAEEDKRQQEAVEAKNQAETMIFQIEKSLTEAGDKFTDADKADVNAAIEKLKETLKGGNTEAIKADTEALQKAFYPLAAKLYQGDPNAQGGGFDPSAGQGEAGGNGDYYNADFEDKTNS